jgi:phosphatidylinositol-3,4,5-trisphosphate 3-phosphatase/dual-specificity protein phosphatase PTEN
MASLLRQIVAGPRARHPEAGLDLCYVTDNIIATSGPGATYPQVAYRNPLKDLVKFLDSKHGEQWAIWEFRAEGTGYPDDEVYNRVHHYPWPDHHPPPFALVPLIMASMRNWLKQKDAKGRVVVVHCKAGKGRSGTMSCSYLISEEGWTPEAALQRFTERRMRPGFGVGISIPSQRRYITYVDRWARHGKHYIEQPMEILEVHVWGLRDGVKIVVEGYVDEGKTIKKFHTFNSSEREIVRGTISSETGFADVVSDILGRKTSVKKKKATNNFEDRENDNTSDGAESQSKSSTAGIQPAGGDVIFRPASRVVLPSSDVNIDFERRNNTNLGGLTMVTSVAHVWFNIFFEGQGPENSGTPDDSGVFEIEWDAMDGIKGSSRKGTRAFDKISVVWKAVELERRPSVVIDEPAEGEEVKEAAAADWRGVSEEMRKAATKKLGLRPDDDDSRSVSRAGSMRSHKTSEFNDSAEELKGVKSDVAPDADDSDTAQQEESISKERSAMKKSNTTPELSTHNDDSSDMPSQVQMDDEAGLDSGVKHLSTGALPDGVLEMELEDHSSHAVGQLIKAKKNETVS